MRHGTSRRAVGKGGTVSRAGRSGPLRECSRAAGAARGSRRCAACLLVFWCGAPCLRFGCAFAARGVWRIALRPSRGMGKWRVGCHLGRSFTTERPAGRVSPPSRASGWSEDRRPHRRLHRAEASPCSMSYRAARLVRNDTRCDPLRRANFRVSQPETYAYLPSSAQTAVACTSRSWRSSAPFGAGMLSDVVTGAVPSALAAAHWT